MRMLWDNLIKEATLSATNEDANYPISNIYHEFIEKVFYSSTPSSVITITLDTVSDIDCVAFGHHNCNSVSFVFKNSGGSQIGSTLTYTVPNQRIMEYVDYDDVATIEVTIQSTSTVFIGNISVGEYYDFPEIAMDIEINITDTSQNEISMGGQVSANIGTALDQINIGIPECEGSFINDLRTIKKGIGISPGIWLDVYEDSDEYDFLYCYWKDSMLRFQRLRLDYGTNLYTCSLTFEEAR
jgi:hypothetical protein